MVCIQSFPFAYFSLLFFSFTPAVSYSSKLDEFLSFLSSARYGVLSSVFPHHKRMLLVSDYPFVSFSDQREVLINSIRALALSTINPIVFLISEGESKQKEADDSSILIKKELLEIGASEVRPCFYFAIFCILIIYVLI